MNDENLCPEQEDMNLSVDSVKAGAAVFGSLVFGTEYPEHSLCYSPSPVANRRNQQNKKFDQLTESTKILDFEATSVTSFEVKKEKTPDQAAERVANEVDIATIKRGGSRRNELQRNRSVPKKPAGLKPSTIANISDDRSADLTAKGGSINPIINEVRRAKEESIKEKILTAAEIREQRRIEREEAVALNAEAEKTRREVLELRKQLNERFARAKIDRENRIRQEHLAKVENEIQFKSKVHVEHKQTLKEMEDARRRMSMDARAKLRQNHRDGKERMRLVAIAEDQALFEERQESSIATQNTKKSNAEQRRQSFAFRNGDARRIRELFAKMEEERSMREHESYELKWAGERDADAYKQQMAKERRDSLAFRNAEGHRIRDLEATMKSDDWAREHESYELKWAGERDADAYKQQMAKERRDSLAFRNQEAAKHDAVMKELLSLARDREHESYMLKWAGENDAKQYLSDQQELRRRSLAFRNAQGKEHREIDEAARSNLILERAKNEELAAACRKDVENYKAECAGKERAALCLRGKEHFANRVQEENDRQTKLEEDHKNHLLDTEAWKDVNDYVEECKRRRRLSLAFRAKEKRRHFEFAKKQAALEVERQHRYTRYRSEDARYVEIAKLREKARIAMESFNYPPECSFGSNPFGTLLD
ncbi:hypothetical protein ACHAW6_009016 [Cyclotella cf. meneghiniana]